MEPTERYFYIDVLRVLAICLVFVFHVNMIFVAEWNWHIKADSKSNVLMEFNYWIQFFRMPLLFFISGFISCSLLKKLSGAEFAIQRFNRLIIPTIIWTFVLVAPQLYFERRLQGFDFTYLEFYKTFLDFEWYPQGNFHWLHLWFIPYLFAYNLLSIPIIKKLDAFGTANNNDALKSKLPMCISVFVTLSVIPYTLLSVRYPVTYDFIHDYARHAQFFPFVLAGLLAFKYSSVMVFLEKKRETLLQLAVLSIVIINALRWNGMEPKNIWDDWLSHPLSYVFLLLLNFNSWLWVLAILGYGKRYLNRGSKLLSYFNKAVFPFYILHQTIIVIIGYYVVQTSDNEAFKYLFIMIAGFMMTLAIYHLYIRPFKLVRKLFGSK